MDEGRDSIRNVEYKAKCGQVPDYQHLMMYYIGICIEIVFILIYLDTIYLFIIIKQFICIHLLIGDKQDGESSLVWLKKNVLPKVAKWSTEVSEDGFVEERGSLQLIDVAEYNEVYQRLKIKYGKPLVKVQFILSLYDVLSL